MKNRFHYSWGNNSLDEPIEVFKHRITLLENGAGDAQELFRFELVSTKEFLYTLLQFTFEHLRLLQGENKTEENNSYQSGAEAESPSQDQAAVEMTDQKIYRYRYKNDPRDEVCEYLARNDAFETLVHRLDKRNARFPYVLFGYNIL